MEAGLRADGRRVEPGEGGRRAAFAVNEARSKLILDSPCFGVYIYLVRRVNVVLLCSAHSLDINMEFPSVSLYRCLGTSAPC